MGYLFYIICMVCLIVLYTINKKTIEGFQTEDTTEKNYVENGSFKDKQFIPNSTGAMNGNSLIVVKNPGESENVLKIEKTDKTNGYMFKVKLDSGKTYRLSLFVHTDKEYKGEIELIRIRQYLTNGSKRLFMSEGNMVSIQSVGDLNWELRDCCPWFLLFLSQCMTIVDKL